MLVLYGKGCYAAHQRNMVHSVPTNTSRGAGALVGQVGVLDARLRAAVLALAPALEQAAREAAGDESAADPSDPVALRLLASQVWRFPPAGSAVCPSPRASQQISIPLSSRNPNLNPTVPLGCCCGFVCLRLVPSTCMRGWSAWTSWPTALLHVRTLCGEGDVLMPWLASWCPAFLHSIGILH